MRIIDWSSDLCSSDLTAGDLLPGYPLDLPGSRQARVRTSRHQTGLHRHSMTLGVPRPSRISGPPDFAAAPLRYPATKSVPPLPASRRPSRPLPPHHPVPLRPTHSMGNGEPGHILMEALLIQLSTVLREVFKA